VPLVVGRDLVRFRKRRFPIRFAAMLRHLRQLRQLFVGVGGLTTAVHRAVAVEPRQVATVAVNLGAEASD
jgi:hypothetical protein